MWARNHSEHTFDSRLENANRKIAATQLLRIARTLVIALRIRQFDALFWNDVAAETLRAVTNRIYSVSREDWRI